MGSVAKQMRHHRTSSYVASTSGAPSPRGLPSEDMLAALAMTTPPVPEAGALAEAAAAATAGAGGSGGAHRARVNAVPATSAGSPFKLPVVPPRK
jgi:hypothetical protein